MNIRVDRAGFALLSVLWLIVALGTLTVTEIGPAIVSQRASENRTQLTRARWAAHGCLAFLRTRKESGGMAPTADSIGLGPSVWCSLESLRPDERVNPNLGDSAGLARALGDPALVAALLDWTDPDDRPRDGGAEAPWYRDRFRATPRDGPLADVSELALVKGFEHLSVQELEASFTTRGDGALSPNRSSGWALRSISDVPEGLAQRLLVTRGRSTFESAEQVVAVLGLEPTIPEFREMVRRLSFADGSDVLRARGYVNAGTRVLSSSLLVTVREDVGALRVQGLEAR